MVDFGSKEKAYKALKVLQEYCNEHGSCTGDDGGAICMFAEYGTGVCAWRDFLKATTVCIQSWEVE